MFLVVVFQICDFPDVKGVDIKIVDFEKLIGEIPKECMQFCQQFPDVIFLKRVADGNDLPIRCGDFDFKINNECIKSMFEMDKFGVDEQGQQRRDKGF